MGGAVFQAWSAPTVPLILNERSRGGSPDVVQKAGTDRSRATSMSRAESSGPRAGQIAAPRPSRGFYEAVLARRPAERHLRAFACPEVCAETRRTAARSPLPELGVLCSAPAPLPRRRALPPATLRSTGLAADVRRRAAERRLSSSLARGRTASSTRRSLGLRPSNSQILYDFRPLGEAPRTSFCPGFSRPWEPALAYAAHRPGLPSPPTPRFRG